MSYADDGALRKALREQFAPEQIGKLPATSKRPALDYVGHAAVTDRLNRVAPDWTYELEPVVVWGRIHVDGKDRRFEPDPSGLPHVVAVFGGMTVGGVTRQEVGEVDAFTTYGDEMKKAISKFIRRGAMRFGVAIDLWGKEDLMSEADTVQPPAASRAADSAGDPSSEREGSETPAATEEADGHSAQVALADEASEAGTEGGGASKAPASEAKTTRAKAGKGSSWPYQPRNCPHTKGQLDDWRVSQSAPSMEICQGCGEARKRGTA